MSATGITPREANCGFRVERNKAGEVTIFWFDKSRGLDVARFTLNDKAAATLIAELQSQHAAARREKKRRDRKHEQV